MNRGIQATVGWVPSGVAKQESGWNDPLFDQSLRTIEVGENRFHQTSTLSQFLRNLLPFGFGKNQWQCVQQPRTGSLPFRIMWIEGNAVTCNLR